MLLTLDQDRTVATLEEVADSSVTTVERLRVHAVQVPHPAREVRLRRANEQVVVVSHQAVGKAAPAKAVVRVCEHLEETLSVRVISKDLRPLVASRRQVVDAVFDLETQRSGHAREGSLARGRPAPLSQRSTGTVASAKTNFFWDVSRSLPQVAQERDGNNSLQRQYIYGQRRIRQTQGTLSYYLYDGLGSVVNTASSTGAVQRTWSYEPFGPIRTQSGTTPTNFMQFAGEYLDPTGLYHLRARQYDPANGRFLSRDPRSAPIGNALVSSYSYADDRPTVLVDASGMTPASDPFRPTESSIFPPLDVSAHFFAGELACFLALETLVPSGGPIGLAGAVLVCGTAGYLEYRDIKKHLEQAEQP